MNCDIISLEEISNIMENFSLIFYVVGLVSHFFSVEVKTGSAQYVMMSLPGFCSLSSWLNYTLISF